MEIALGKRHELILGILTSRGIATSNELQIASGKSQPTVSRLLADLSSQVVALGRARARRYGIQKSIHGLPARQPIHWTSEDGAVRRVGTLTLLLEDIVHVDSAFGEGVSFGALPWYLAPLRAQGFLGRLHAQRLASLGVPADPQAWDVEAALFAATQLTDAPGAMTLGDAGAVAREPVRLPADPARQPTALDALASDVARTLPAGSSAAGEQPKFLALTEQGRHVLVKFTPPRGTPFGDRWGDLLHAEVLASRVLRRYGVPVATAAIVESDRRTYLVSERFDRVGERGRRHVVSVGAAHAGFVAGSFPGWSAACEALHRQRRLSAQDAARVTALQQFGHLIGNTDMHAGNLGLFVLLEPAQRGRFTLAPVYDMLPMRWRPDAAFGGARDYAPFEPEPISAGSAAAVPARAYWRELAVHDRVSEPLREVAAEMAERLAAR